MANIYDVNLSRKSLAGDISEITVTHKVAFNSFERNNTVRFREYIQLWGDDLLSDDYLYRAPTGAFNSQNTPLTRTRKFRVANSILNEDWGRDEVYAKVKIYPVMPTSDSENSNIITGWF